MIQARVNQGRIEPQEQLPTEWEGQLVKIMRLTPDDPLLNLDDALAALAVLGPMEFMPGEREGVDELLGELDQLSRNAMQDI